jgi:hypothetical protein
MSIPQIQALFRKQENQVCVFPHFQISPFPICKSGSSSFGRAIAFQAIGGEFEPRLPLIAVPGRRPWIPTFPLGPGIRPMTEHRRCSSVVEHFLGKEEVKGSIPFNGSISAKFFKSFSRVQATDRLRVWSLDADIRRRRIVCIQFPLTALFRYSSLRPFAVGTLKSE